MVPTVKMEDDLDGEDDGPYCYCGHSRHSHGVTYGPLGPVTCYGCADEQSFVEGANPSHKYQEAS